MIMKTIGYKGVFPIFRHTQMRIPKSDMMLWFQLEMEKFHGAFPSIFQWQSWGCVAHWQTQISFEFSLSVDTKPSTDWRPTVTAIELLSSQFWQQVDHVFLEILRHSRFFFFSTKKTGWAEKTLWISPFPKSNGHDFRGPYQLFAMFWTNHPEQRMTPLD